MGRDGLIPVRRIQEEGMELIDRLKKYAEQFKRMKVLVVGDLILDEYIWGKATRISPEAPVPVVLVDRVTCFPGGAFNVAVNIIRMGGRAMLSGVVGDDESKKKMFEFAREYGLNPELFVVDPKRPTTRKVRVIARSQHVVRIDFEMTDDIDEELSKEWLGIIKSTLRTHKPAVLVIEDYEKGLLNSRTIPSLLEFARELGIPVIVDPKFANFMLYSEVDVIKCNVRELNAQFAGREARDEVELRERIISLYDRLKPRWLIVTAGGEGAYICYNNGAGLCVERYIARSIEVIDVTGAGDTFVSMIALMYGCGASIGDAVHVANVAASLTCEHLGPYAPDTENVIQACTDLLND